MAKSGYSITTEGEVALAAAGTAKTILGLDGNANFGIDLKSWWVDFDGVTAAEKPVKVQLLVCTFATNAPGTNSTTVTVKQTYGRLAGTGFAAAKNWTAEPTTIESQAYDEFGLDPVKGVYRYDWPLGESPDCALDSGFIIRVLVETGDTVTASIRAGMRFERT
jgi:hypothetical protein